MKLSKCLFFVLLFITPAILSAQSIVSNWHMDGKAPDGTTIVNLVSFKADGSMTVDFASDGTIDVKATYTMNGNQVSINDTSADSPCYGKVGVYEISVSGDTLSAKVISDPCDERRGDGKAGTMKRAN